MVDYQQIIIDEYVGVEGGEIMEDPFWDVALERTQDQLPEDLEFCDEFQSCYKNERSCGCCNPTDCIVRERLQQEINICWDVKNIFDRYPEDVYEAKWAWMNGEDMGWYE
jgi:hypothetical protein